MIAPHGGLPSDSQGRKLLAKNIPAGAAYLVR
jgi:hypothetical protein